MRYKPIYANYAGNQEKHHIRNQNRQHPRREIPSRKIQLHRKQGGNCHGK